MSLTTSAYVPCIMIKRQRSITSVIRHTDNLSGSCKAEPKGSIENRLELKKKTETEGIERPDSIKHAKCSENQDSPPP